MLPPCNNFNTNMILMFDSAVRCTILHQGVPDALNSSNTVADERVAQHKTQQVWMLIN
jgi:hypothetical protein